MMDLSDKGSECEGTSGVTTPTPDSDYSNLKTCIDCGTSRTPLWRGGPAGPKSLCNACGIRSRKKRRALMGGGVGKEDKKSTKKSTAKNTSDSCTSSSGDSSVKIRDPLNKKLWAHVALQRPRSSGTRRRKVGREEEQAAFLLMALSCGSVYA